MQVDPRVGGRFEIFGGAVRAVFTELSPQRIALDWHFNSWKEGVVSKVQPCVCCVYGSAPMLLVLARHAQARACNLL